MAGFEVFAVGTVENGVSRRPPEGWRETVSRIRLDPRWLPALDGIDAYSHLLVLAFLPTTSRDCLKVRPHRPGAPETGVFATDSPCRPNPITATVVELLSREGPVLTVRGLDLYDGTPVVDVKPFIPPAIPRFRAPAWACAQPMAADLAP
jgi:tRNA-Thr(GGU) m(6)t(6)A37 methyltransferase TsaA